MEMARYIFKILIHTQYINQYELHTRLIILYIFTDLLSPLYLQILCPLCILNIGSQTPVLLDKTAYITHFRHYHWNYTIVTGLFTPTSYHARMYQANLLYTLCLAHPIGTTKPTASALTKTFRDFPNLYMDKRLADYLGTVLKLTKHTPQGSDESCSGGSDDILSTALINSGIADTKKGKR